MQTAFHSGTTRHMRNEPCIGGCELSFHLRVMSCFLSSVCLSVSLFCLSSFCVDFLMGRGERGHHLFLSRHAVASLTYIIKIQFTLALQSKLGTREKNPRKAKAASAIITSPPVVRIGLSKFECQHPMPNTPKARKRVFN